MCHVESPVLGVSAVLGPVFEVGVAHAVVVDQGFSTIRYFNYIILDNLDQGGVPGGVSAELCKSLEAVMTSDLASAIPFPETDSQIRRYAKL